MSITPYPAGQFVTTRRLQFPVVLQHTINFLGSVDGTETVIDTIVVPAQGVPTIQIPSAFWSPQPSDDAGATARWRMRIRDTNTSGIERGTSLQSHSSGTAGTVRFSFSLPMCTARAVQSGSATYVVTMQRAVGASGTLTQQQNGVFTILVLPDPSSM